MAENMGLMRGKRGVILGVANNRSIAYGIAKSCRDQGAELALTWQGDALKKRVEPLAKELGAITLGHCDVTDAATIDAVFAEVKKQWDAMGTEALISTPEAFDQYMVEQQRLHVHHVADGDEGEG